MVFPILDAVTCFQRQNTGRADGDGMWVGGREGTGLKFPRRDGCRFLQRTVSYHYYSSLPQGFLGVKSRKDPVLPASPGTVFKSTFISLLLCPACKLSVKGLPLHHTKNNRRWVLGFK